MQIQKGLTIDLKALANNWQALKAHLNSSAECAAVVKANAYGLGVSEVLSALKSAGCKTFFVATLDEALEIISLLSENDVLYVLSGCRAGEEGAFIDKGIRPVIISLHMFNRWLQTCKQYSQEKSTPKCALKVNTGMNRLGMEGEELQQLLEDPQAIKMAGLEMLMSHLACADEPSHKLNTVQLSRFQTLVNQVHRVLPACQFSLSNSSGIFLGEDYHFDLLRPGIALYGGQVSEKIAIKPVVHLNLEVLQTRLAQKGESVGYGATYTLDKDRELITVAAGYADGFLRFASNRAQAYFKGQFFPLVGRVSMDSLIFDVSELEYKPQAGDLIEVLGEHISIDELAAQCGTISYEIITSLGARYPRHYIR